jgi:hypothetical protein
MLKHQHSLLSREVSFHSGTQLLSCGTQPLLVAQNYFPVTHSHFQWYTTIVVVHNYCPETHSLRQWYITIVVAKGLAHMALPCGLLEATPSRNTRVNSP